MIESKFRSTRGAAWLLGATLLASGSGLACQGKTAAAEGTQGSETAPLRVERTTVKVDAVTVAEEPVPVFATFSGSLVADKESVVAAGASGKVLQTFVERGQFVQAGAVLAKLDARTASAMAAEAQAQVDSARTQQELAKAECDRNQQMFDKGAISQAEYDRVKANCTTAQFTAQAAEARKSNVAISLRDSEIRAPFAGYIGERFVNAGEYVAPSSRVASLVSTHPLRAQLTVPEAYATSISVGQKIKVQLTNDAKQTVIDATIRYVSPAIRQASRDLIVEALVDNPKGALKPGYFITARADLGEKPFPVVPTAAIRSDGTTSRVFVVSGGAIEERIVQLGVTVDDKVAVTDGLKANEKIAAVASAELRDGQKVQ